MMLAKLSGSGSSTATSRVSSADRSQRRQHQPTSSTRRSATSRMIVIATTAMIAASRNAPTMVSLVASMVTAEPPASGAIAVTCSTNCAQTLTGARLWRRQHLHARSPVRQQPVARHVGRDRAERHRFGAQHGAQPVELFRQEARQRAIGRRSARRRSRSAAGADRRRSRPADDPSAASPVPDRSAPARSSPPAGSDRA